MKSVSYILKFPIDLKSFEAACKAQVNSVQKAETDLKAVFVNCSDEISNSDHNKITAIFNALTHDGEAAKLSKASCLVGQDRKNYENEMKRNLSQKNWDQLTPTQRLFLSGGTLTDAEFDNLPTG